MYNRAIKIEEHKTSTKEIRVATQENTQAERQKGNVMKAVVTVTGKDKVGIIAMASDECLKNQVNIIDISQTVMKEYFAMIMLVELDGMKGDFASFAESMRVRGAKAGVDIRVMHEDIFNSMHKI